MWVLLSFVSIIFLSFYDITSKKLINKDKLAPFKIRVSALAVEFIVAIVLYLLKVGESGLAPWQILFNYPILLLGIAVVILTEIFFAISLRFLGLTIFEAITGLGSLFLLLEMVVLNLITGRIQEIQKLQPLQIIFLLFMVVGVVLLPFIKNTGEKNTVSNTPKKSHLATILIGIMFVVIALIFESMDGLLITTLQTDDKLGSMDLMMTMYFISIIFTIPMYIFVSAKEHKPFFPKKDEIKSYIFFIIVFILHKATYIFSIALEPIKASFIWTIYPIIPMIFARIFLKEKYNVTQYLCIILVLISSIAFSVIDYI